MPSPLPPLTNTWSPSLPPGYGWEHRNQQQLVVLDSFVRGIDSRDSFEGELRCLVCGERNQLQHCHIIPKSTPYQWTQLINILGWLPPQAKSNGANEPRNGILLCKNHHYLFDHFYFFIRFFPDTKKFVVVSFNYPDNPDVETSTARQLEPFHGKAIPLNINHRLSPFPSLFLQHEIKSRASHLSMPTLDIPDSSVDIPYQDWTHMVHNANTTRLRRSTSGSKIRYICCIPLLLLANVALLLVFYLRYHR